MINGITFTHRNALQCNATVERLGANARDAIRDRDRGQAFAPVERIVADARHAAVRRNYAVFASGYQGFGCGSDQAVSI